MTDTLTMSFDPLTIEHLGIKMYSVLPNAIAELIANAYDAEANVVRIKLYDDENGKRISVIDDGLGMSFEEINEKFLRIGRKRRKENELSPNKKRLISGRKGLGKLAFFGIGDTIHIKTFQGGNCSDFTLSWNDLTNTHDPEYKMPCEISSCEINAHGTTIELADLKRKSDFDINALSISISKLFNFQDNDFKVYISYNDEPEFPLEDKMKFEGLSEQIRWIIPENVSDGKEYFKTHNIKGNIIATEKPLRPGYRGITLYAHGRLVNSPEFFDVGESSHGYSYLTGWLDVDFIDEDDVDYISTDRQSLSWDLPIAAELRKNLKKLMSGIEQEWRTKRKAQRQKRLSEKTQINIDDWYGKLPSLVKPNVESIVNIIVDNSELEDEKQSKVVNKLHDLIPEYPYYHWRHLHNVVKDASKVDYQKEDYHRAVEETIKRYESKVSIKSALLDSDGADLMFKAFGEKGVLSVSKNYTKPDGTLFSDKTKKNIEIGQQQMSAGLMSGVRNPIAHEEKQQLYLSGLFTENDCLDILSLLSHLFRRLDDAEKVK